MICILILGGIKTEVVKKMEKRKKYPCGKNYRIRSSKKKKIYE